MRRPDDEEAGEPSGEMFEDVAKAGRFEGSQLLAGAASQIGAAGAQAGRTRSRSGPRAPGPDPGPAVGRVDRSDWVRNLIRHPEVTVRLGLPATPFSYAGRARPVDPGSDEDELARRLVTGKYQPTYGGDLSSWRDSSLPVAVDLAQPAG